MEDCNEPGFCHWTDLSGRLMRVNEQLFVWKSVIQPNSLIAINYSYQTKELLPQTKAMINLHLFKDLQMKCRCNLQVKENMLFTRKLHCPLLETFGMVTLSGEQHDIQYHYHLQCSVLLAQHKLIRTHVHNIS